MYIYKIKFKVPFGQTEFEREEIFTTKKTCKEFLKKNVLPKDLINGVIQGYKATNDRFYKTSGEIVVYTIIPENKTKYNF